MPLLYPHAVYIIAVTVVTLHSRCCLYVVVGAIVVVEEEICNQALLKH